ncbi:hypothetical protein [Vibrio parahaemolyticus]|uniref:hypothetical protein n=1 Tax=Vibrio parahaemolyticus TaxID=670 RepID=UPI0007B6E0E4|nr:hypothetical protein [Vibrio parahaemolyticus]ANB96766.1 hypothetical protein FORC14_1875 [Vibrio parahaemolyticus]EGQ8609086.1 hypothetical protein [Vibrio parahaemolyticus]
MIDVHVGNGNEIVNVTEIQAVIEGLKKANCTTADSRREMAKIATATRVLETTDFIHTAAYYYVATHVNLSTISSIHIAMGANQKLVTGHL